MKAGSASHAELLALTPSEAHDGVTLRLHSSQVAARPDRFMLGKYP